MIGDLIRLSEGSAGGWASSKLNLKPGLNMQGKIHLPADNEEGLVHAHLD